MQIKDHEQSETLNEKEKNEAISPNSKINMLKKLFCKTKNCILSVSNQESLLFDRNRSLALLKAYRNRKKLILIDSLKKSGQYNFEKISINNRLTLDIPEIKEFCLQSTKYDINKYDVGQKFYKQIRQKIQNSPDWDSFKLPKLEKITPKKSKGESKSENQNSNFNQKTVPILNGMNRFDNLKTLDSNSNNNQQIKSQFYRKKNVKNSRKGQRILLLKQIVRHSLQNSQISLKSKLNLLNQSNSSVSQLKIAKECPMQQNTQNLPELKSVKSVKSLPNQGNSLRKGYLFFDQEAKKFLKQNKEKLDQPAKIKQFLISGITATCYAVVDIQTMTPLATKNFLKKIQIASISKVMTCYLCLLACKKYRIDFKKHQVKITLEASETNGTSADLEIGDILTLEDLLYGLMLPSGNDASVAIAQTIGKIIHRQKKKQTKKTYYQTFIAHMNMLSREFKLEQEWKNSHGLPVHPNHSTTQAICLLTIAAMMNEKFREIVSCKQYETTIRNQRSGLKKVVKWTNTNKLLYEGWEGVKTGNTDSAGYCLMAKKDRYLIAIFDSKTMSKRFNESTQLYQLVKSKERFLYSQKWE